MFNSIGTLLKKKRTIPTQPSSSDLILTTARLMLEVIRVDGVIGKIELITMSEVLKRNFNLGQDELNRLFETISTMQLDDNELGNLTKTICEEWGNAKRLNLLENLWIVALADQTIDSTESDLVRKLAGLICLNEMQIYQSHENAKSKLGIEDF